MNQIMFKIKQYIKYFDKIKNDINNEFKKFSWKFDGEIENLEKFLIEFYKNDLTDSMP